MLIVGQKAADEAQGRAMIRDLIASGKGLAKFKECIKAQGGSTSWIGKRPLTKAEQVFTAVSTDGGYITRIDAGPSAKSPWKWAPVGRGKKTPLSPWSASASLKNSTIRYDPAKPYSPYTERKQTI